MNTLNRPKWALLCEAPDKWEAHFIRGRLEAAGIPVHIIQEAVAELYGITHGSLAAVKILVPKNDLETARALLAAPPEPDDEQ